MKARGKGQPRKRPAKKPLRAKRPKNSRVRATNGEKAAVELVVGKNPAKPAPDEEQIDWIDDLLGPVSTEKVRGTLYRASRIGRPPGAKNKRTVEWAEYLLSRYGSPLEVLAQIANMSVDELVAGLRCTKLEALQEKRFAAIALAPFLHSKQPVAVDITNRNVVYLTINADKFEVGHGAGLTATVIEGKPNGPDAQPRLEPAGAGSPGLHGGDEVRPDHQRPDRVG